MDIFCAPFLIYSMLRAGALNESLIPAVLAACGGVMGRKQENHKQKGKKKKRLKKKNAIMGQGRSRERPRRGECKLSQLSVPVFS